MKRFFRLMLLFAVTIFSSCEKENDETMLNQILGTWEATQCKSDGDWITIPSYSNLNISISFYNDGRYYGDSDIFGSGWGTYTLSGKTIKTYINNKLLYTYYIKSITSSSAEVTMFSGSSSIEFRLKKVK